jgi:cell division transport system permease protein
MAVENLESLALVWGRSATLTAYIDDRLEPEAWPPLRERLAGFDSVARAELVTPVQALERFRARGPKAAALVEGVVPEVLPASIELHLEAGFTDLAMVEAVAREVHDIPGIADVDYGQEEFERLGALLAVLRWGGLAAGLLIALATAFIVSNTIRLTVYARREEISIQRLVGATAWFIRMPFLIEGAVWGLVGGVAGAGLLWLADLLAAPRLTQAVVDVVGGLDVRLFALDVGLGMILAGTALGVGGSFLAVRRFLDLESP